MRLLAVAGTRTTLVRRPSVAKALVHSVLSRVWSVGGYEGVVHGASPLGGVDEWVDEWARENGVPVIAIPPACPRAECLRRRTVEVVRVGAALLAIYVDAYSRGTTLAISTAKRMGKPVTVYYVDSLGKSYRRIA